MRPHDVRGGDRHPRGVQTLVVGHEHVIAPLSRFKLDFATPIQLCLCPEPDARGQYRPCKDLAGYDVSRRDGRGVCYVIEDPRGCFCLQHANALAALIND